MPWLNKMLSLSLCNFSNFDGVQLHFFAQQVIAVIKSAMMTIALEMIKSVTPILSVKFSEPSLAIPTTTPTSSPFLSDELAKPRNSDRFFPNFETKTVATENKQPLVNKCNENRCFSPEVLHTN